MTIETLRIYVWAGEGKEFCARNAASVSSGPACFDLGPLLPEALPMAERQILLFLYMVLIFSVLYCFFFSLIFFIYTHYAHSKQIGRIDASGPVTLGREIYILRRHLACLKWRSANGARDDGKHRCPSGSCLFLCFSASVFELKRFWQSSIEIPLGELPLQLWTCGLCLNSKLVWRSIVSPEKAVSTRCLLVASGRDQNLESLYIYLQKLGPLWNVPPGMKPVKEDRHHLPSEFCLCVFCPYFRFGLCWYHEGLSTVVGPVLGVGIIYCPFFPTYISIYNLLTSCCRPSKLLGQIYSRI